MIDPIVDKQRWAMYSSGLFDRQIAELQGVSKKTVANWRNSRQLPPNKQQWFVVKPKEVSN